MGIWYAAALANPSTDTQSVILRTHAVMAFSKSLHSAGRALPDALGKDTLKALRAGLADKALPIQRASADAYVSLHRFTSACPLQATLESVFPVILRSLETADHPTRRSMSRLLAHLLAATQMPGSGTMPVESSKKAAQANDQDGEAEGTIVTSANDDRNSKTLYTPAEMPATALPALQSSHHPEETAKRSH